MKIIKKIVSYFVGIVYGRIDLWGREISVWSSVVDEKIGIDYRHQVWSETDIK